MAAEKIKTGDSGAADLSSRVADLMTENARLRRLITELLITNEQLRRLYSESLTFID